ncbi:MAG: tetratricopeptide repeat protein, partial [Thermodesulfobacteriota bacterium]|nr:tetratricopeptide repeat protein [Thermodesulfobacteriota bacterium]
GSDTGWQAKVRRSIEFYWSGDLTSAFSSLEGVPEDIQDPRFFTYRAGLLLTVGCVDEADVDIKKALNLDPSNSQAITLQSVIAVVQNQRDQALDLARKAVELAPESPAARVALSYAQQADFNLQDALSSLKEAVELGPENALAWSRLSELRLSFGDLDKAFEAAKKAVVLNPNISHTQTVLGFSYLTQIKISDAKNAFKKAIELDQAAPLPRLGLGLAKIRDGDLKEGREEIEIASSLDPDNSLIRSYLGKAYYEEKCDKLAKNQFAMAKELDPKDPTAWFYGAILKQSQNRPVEALEDLQKSIELNDNRAVYRSRLMLDEDLAARSASLGRIYNDLGFQQLALVEGWKSVNTDPANYSAHRFLADSYAALPRHEIARVSELLQSQLLQPINITPVQPSLAESKLFILEGVGPSDPSFNEFNPLFERNRLALQASGVVGGNSILGDELVQSGLQGRFSYSLGQFHYETDGFRANNDLKQDIYNLFTQVSLSYRSSLQLEFRSEEKKNGDLLLRFDPDNFSKALRENRDDDSIRLGYHFAPSVDSDIIASFIYNDGTLRRTDNRVLQETPSGPVVWNEDRNDDNKGYTAEAQYQSRKISYKYILGIGYHENDYSKDPGVSITLGPNVLDESSKEDYTTRHPNAYLYSHITVVPNVTLTLGVSADSFDCKHIDINHLNPKFGLTWNLSPKTTLRVAGFRTLKRSLVSNQTIEPTQVAGFNQFFDDVLAADSKRYGIGLDHKFSTKLFCGIEFTGRDVDVPEVDHEEDQDELLHRAYLYWTPDKRFAIGGEYQYERFKRDRSMDPSKPNKLKTQRLPLTANYYHPNGLFGRLMATYVDQEIELPGVSVDHDYDTFWVVDASIGYRLPKRYGIISVDMRNLFDQDFKFHDIEFQSGTKPRNVWIQPDRIVLVRLTLSF